MTLLTLLTHLLLTLLGAVLFAATLPLVLELALVTAANFLPGSRSNRPNSISSTAAGSDAGPESQIAILVPAHNEEGLIARCVTSLIASRNADPGFVSPASAKFSVRILVIAHNCQDGTAKRALEAGAEVIVYNDPHAVGKGFALRYGFERALAEGAQAVLVVDADSIVSPNTISVVIAALFAPAPSAANRPRAARVVQCRYQMESTTERSSTQLAALAFRGFNVIRPRGRDRLGLSAGILGNGFGLLRPVLETIPYDALSVVEDLEYHLHLVMAGERVRYLDQALISADFPESRSGESIQRSRWEGGRLHTARIWALPLLGRILRGNLRLLEPLCDLTGLPLAYGVFGLLFALALPLGWLRSYAAIALAIVLMHVLTAAWAGPNFLRTLGLLAMAPVYIVRKLLMIPGVVKGSSGKAAWVRTERDTTL